VIPYRRRTGGLFAGALVALGSVLAFVVLFAMCFSLSAAFGLLIRLVVEGIAGRTFGEWWHWALGGILLCVFFGRGATTIVRRDG
jgi:ABC-type multidrug transport system permease subunit